MNDEIKFYKQEWFMLLCMLLIAPIGIFLMFKYHASRYSNVLKISISILAVMVLFSRFSSSNVVESKKDNKTAKVTVSVTETVTETVTVTPATPEPTLTEAEKKAENKKFKESQIIEEKRLKEEKNADIKRKKEEKIAEEKRLKVEKAENEKIFSSGNYISGKDFKAGIYDVIAIKGGGNVHAGNVWTGGFSAIMGVKDDGFYEKEYKNVELPDGVKLEVKGLTIKLIFKE